MQFFFDSILYSYAQIFFCNRLWFGGVAFAVTLLNPKIGLMGLLGVALSNLTAYALKFDTAKIRSGYYGFNGLLFGAAAAYYYEINIQLLFLIPIFVIVTFALSAVIEHHFAAAFNLPGLSIPFITALIVFIVFLTNFKIVTQGLHTPLIDIGNAYTGMFSYYFKSLGLILVQPGIIPGIVLAIAILLFSRVAFVLSITSYILNYYLLRLILPEQFDSLIILTSLNSILTALALGGSLIIPSFRSFLLALSSTILVIIATGFFAKVFYTSHLPILVMPFNFIVLIIIYALKFRQEHTELTLLYFKPGSPEENLYYHRNRINRFEKFRYFYPEMPFFGEWFVSQGVDGKLTHKGEWKDAVDFVVVDSDSSQFSDKGDYLADYYCFNIPVAAPLDGEIVKVIDGIPDNPIGDVNLDKNWGNTIIIDHKEGLFSSFSHLEADTIKVEKGDRVKKGDIIASCGNSGRSPYPHLHFQFQMTDKLGDRTLNHPFAYFIEKKGNEIQLKTFEYPKEGTVVQNIEIHKTLKKAFLFKFGDKLSFKCKFLGQKSVENWEVKVNIYNELYIESDNGAFAYLTPAEKVFYFNSFSGNRHSGLYYFYLSALRVPLCLIPNLKWTDSYQPTILPETPAKILSEFFLLVKPLISVSGEFCFEDQQETNDKIVITGKIKALGSWFLRGYKRNYNSKIVLSSHGEIESFNYFYEKNEIFSAQINSN